MQQQFRRQITCVVVFHLMPVLPSPRAHFAMQLHKWRGVQRRHRDDAGAVVWTSCIDRAPGAAASPIEPSSGVRHIISAEKMRRVGGHRCCPPTQGLCSQGVGLRE